MFYYQYIGRTLTTQTLLCQMMDLLDAGRD